MNHTCAKRSICALRNFSSFFNVFDPEDQNFNCVVSDISALLRETTLTISVSNETGSPVKFKIVRVVSLSTTELSEITRLKLRYLGLDTLSFLLEKMMILPHDLVAF